MKLTEKMTTTEVCEKIEKKNSLFKCYRSDKNYKISKIKIKTKFKRNIYIQRKLINHLKILS